MKSAMENLKATLRQLGFDERIDFKVELAIGKKLPSFTVPYRIDMDRDIVFFDLCFKKIKKTHDYQLDKCDTYLLRKIDIPAIKIDGVDLAELEKRLRIIKREQVTTLSQPITDELYISIFQDLTTLRKTSVGYQVADLFAVRYLPEFLWSEELIGRMAYNTLVERYFIRQAFDAKAITSAAECGLALSREMDGRTPKFEDVAQEMNPGDQERKYLVTALAMDVKKRKKVTILGSKTFSAAEEAAALLTGMDHRLFDKAFIRQHTNKFKWALEEVSLLKEESRKPLVTLRSISLIPTTPGRGDVKRGVALAIYHPELGKVEFMRELFPATKVLASQEEISRMEQTLSQLGLVSQEKKISTKVIPALGGMTTKRKMNRGGRKPGS